jgi:transposase
VAPRRSRPRIGDRRSSVFGVNACAGGAAPILAEQDLADINDENAGISRHHRPVELIRASSVASALIDVVPHIAARETHGRSENPGVGHLTALAFTAAVDDPERFRRSRDLGAYLGLVPRRYQSGEVDYTGGVSKCGDRRMRNPVL